MFKSISVDTFDDILKHFCCIPSSQRALIPNVVTIANLILVNPSTSCTPERSFSTARRSKTWLRANMLTKRFNNLAILSTHKDLTDTFDFIAVGNEFADKHDQRKINLGKFIPEDLN